jgi:Leucine-rich repeat (LRR) protein
MLQNLKELPISGHALTSTMPKEIGDLTKLEFLDLSFGALTVPISAEIGKLPFKSLNLAHNGLTGFIAN